MLIVAYTNPGPPTVKHYEYVTGNLELMVRMQAGEPMQELMEEIRTRWQIGNESLWDDYDIESLIDTDEKRYHMVNNLLYSRIAIFRALRVAGHDCAGHDPFKFAHKLPDLCQELTRKFPPLQQILEQHNAANPSGD
jgi:hypothetical protein